MFICGELVTGPAVSGRSIERRYSLREPDLAQLSRRSCVVGALFAPVGIALAPQAHAQVPAYRMQTWPQESPRSAGIHDLAPAPDGGVWFTAQRAGQLGWFDPGSGKTDWVALGSGSAPHGVIQGPDGAAWITDGGQNAIIRVSWPQREVQRFPLPAGTPYANLNTCAFDGDGDLWFTGQAGVVGKVALKTGVVTVQDAPGGRGPYGICMTPKGEVWWCSLAGSFIAKIDLKTGRSTVVRPPTLHQGARRVWSDSRGRIWVSEWNSGNLSMHDPADASWRVWRLPGGFSAAGPRAYAVYVDERDTVWVSDWGGNAMFSFNPVSEQFQRHAMLHESASVRQILGRPGEVWLPESGADHLSVIRSV